MKHLIIAIISAFSFSAVAQEAAAPLWQTDVAAAVDLSIKENKPLFLFFTGSDWCGWCKRLQSEVFSKPEFQKWAKEKVILVELDFPRMKQLDPNIQQQNVELAQMFQVRGYPTVWFATATKADTQISLGKIGSSGYMAGGPEVWIGNANSILAAAVQP